MIPASVRIFVCAEPQDMPRSFDGLALAAQQHLGEDPQGGAVFVFCNKRRDRLKALWFDRNGFCIFYKRLHRRFLPAAGFTASSRGLIYATCCACFHDTRSIALSNSHRRTGSSRNSVRTSGCGSTEMCFAPRNSRSLPTTSASTHGNRQRVHYAVRRMLTVKRLLPCSTKP